MTMRNRMKTEYIAIAFGLLGCTGHQPTYEYIFEAEPVDLQVKQIEGGYEVEGTSGYSALNSAWRFLNVPMVVSASWASSTTRTGLPLTLPRGMPKALQIRMSASLATNTTCTMRQQ